MLQKTPSGQKNASELSVSEDLRVFWCWMCHFDILKVCKVKKTLLFWNLHITGCAVCARSAGLHSSRDEARVAAFCAVSLFPCMDSSFKSTCWPQTKRKAAPTKGTPPLLVLGNATEWRKGHFEDSSLERLSGFAPRDRAFPPSGLKVRRFCGKWGGKFLKSVCFRRWRLRLTFPLAVFASARFGKSRVSTDELADRSNGIRRSIKLLPRATASANSTRAHRLSRTRRQVSHGWIRLRYRPRASRPPQHHSGLGVSCFVSRADTHTRAASMKHTLYCNSRAYRCGVGRATHRRVTSPVPLTPSTVGGGGLYLSINARYYTNQMGFEEMKCLRRQNHFSFLFFFHSGGRWFIRSDRSQAHQRATDQGDNQKTTDGVGCRSVNTRDDLYYCPFVPDVSCCSLLPLLYSSVSLISLAWDTSFQKSASCKSKPN